MPPQVLETPRRPDHRESEATVAENSVPETRFERGIRLYLERRDEIERVSTFTWHVPSCSSEETYIVWLGLGGSTCLDHKRAKALGVGCKHYTAAYLAHQHRRELRARKRGNQ